MSILNEQAELARTVHAEAEKLARAILTRRRIKCRAQGYHVEDGCPSCGL